MIKLNKSGRLVVGLAVCLTLFALGSAMADSSTVSYQGVLRTATDVPVADGTYTLVFSIWDAETGGAEVWGPETQSNVATANGTFSVYLGSVEPLGSLFSEHTSLWLEVTADVGSGPETFSPRVPLASVPYAQSAGDGVPIGTIISAYIGLPGVPSVAQYQQRGWALCDGTTPASQGIANSPITAALPDLNGQGLFLRGSAAAGTVQSDSVGPHGHPGSFSANTSTQPDHAHTFSATTSLHGGHAHAQNVSANFNSGGPAWRVDFDADGSGAGPYSQGINTDPGGAHNHTVSGTAAGGGNHSHTVSGSVTVNNNTGTTETRPVNMSVVYFIKAR